MVLTLIAVFVVLVYFAAKNQVLSCTPDRMENCTEEEFNAICDTYVDRGTNDPSGQCDAYCETVASSGTVSGIARYVYCLKDPRFKPFSACDVPGGFSSPACDREQRAYCSRAEGEALCNAICDYSTDNLSTGLQLPSTAGDIATVCDSAYCASKASESATNLCLPCFRAQDVTDPVCAARPEMLATSMCSRSACERSPPRV